MRHLSSDNTSLPVTIRVSGFGFRAWQAGEVFATAVLWEAWTESFSVQKVQTFLKKAP